MQKYRCLICNSEVSEEDVSDHKRTFHPELRHYGLMWPSEVYRGGSRDLAPTPIIQSAVIAKELGVRTVYIKDEGRNLSGSMKDYSVERAIQLGTQAGFRTFFVVSSGNHAVSLAKYAGKKKARAVVFTPASSSKVRLLSALPGVFVVGIRNAIFEDVYTLVAGMGFESYYNANVSNELLLSGFFPVAESIEKLDPPPTHILAGVGNGSYLAGIVAAWRQKRLPKVIPVGMEGAFPAQAAYRSRSYLKEYAEFRIAEHLINAAEGSIAIASYSLPQLMEAVYRSGGFPLGGLLNDDLGLAYDLLASDRRLLEAGAVPEPTGIMGLAAALKHKDRFGPDDVILISFTGHGSKDLLGIRQVASEKEAKRLEKIAAESRRDLVLDEKWADLGNILYIDKGIPPKLLEEKINRRLRQRGGSGGR